MNDFTAYTDGGCRPNPGVGGWGWVIYEKNIEIIDYGGEKYSTNNRMELTALLNLLKFLPTTCSGTIYTDSMTGIYKPLINPKHKNGELITSSYSGWMEGWKNSNWSRPKMNKEYYKKIDQELQRLIRGGSKIYLKWINSHTGIVGNERADELATLGIHEQNSN